MQHPPQQGRGRFIGPHRHEVKGQGDRKGRPYPPTNRLAKPVYRRGGARPRSGKLLNLMRMGADLSRPSPIYRPSVLDSPSPHSFVKVHYRPTFPNITHKDADPKELLLDAPTSLLYN